MKHVKKSVLLWYSPREMFDLVVGFEDYPRFLPWCDRAEVLEQGGLARLRRRGARAQHHEGVPDLSPARVGHAHHRGERDGRVGEERGLDLERVDVLAAGDEHVLLPPGHERPRRGDRAGGGDGPGGWVSARAQVPGGGDQFHFER